MKIITLTTDFGEKDYSAGAVKGALYAAMPDIRIVDISHSISPFDILQTAYVLKNAYPHFPKGSIHIIGVDAEKTPEKRHLVMKHNGHYFIGADNGIFHLIANNNPQSEIFEIHSEEAPNCFPTLYDFPKITAQLCKGFPIETLGNRFDDYYRMTNVRAEVNNNRKVIEGHIIYIDHYGNAVSNISRELFEEVNQNRPYEIFFNSYKFNKIHKTYSHIINFSIPKTKRSYPEGKEVVLFNSEGLLELAVYKSNMQNVGGAATLFGLKYLDKVSVHFG
ncbi:MAG: SAM-dependent chlorinase/fluorinase [Capnocytophaga sp.]|nr:SAM-dependent chlorinase/fluorinase [Capnocytophaga sp.]